MRAGYEHRNSLRVFPQTKKQKKLCYIKMLTLFSPKNICPQMIVCAIGSHRVPVDEAA